MNRILQDFVLVREQVDELSLWDLQKKTRENMKPTLQRIDHAKDKEDYGKGCIVYYKNSFWHLYHTGHIQLYLENIIACPCGSYLGLREVLGQNPDCVWARRTHGYSGHL